MSPLNREQDGRAAASAASARRRRRLPSPTEQARRVAWGKKYGAIMAQHAQRIRLREGR